MVTTTPPPEGKWPTRPYPRVVPPYTPHAPPTHPQNRLPSLLPIPRGDKAQTPRAPLTPPDKKRKREKESGESGEKER